MENAVTVDEAKVAGLMAQVLTAADAKRLLGCLDVVAAKVGSDPTLEAQRATLLGLLAKLDPLGPRKMTRCEEREMREGQE